MTVITSKDNARLKEYRKLCTSKKHRSDSGCFALEGVRLICDCGKSNAVITDLLVTERCMEKMGADFSAIEKNAGKILVITEQLAKAIGETDSPQGIFAICKGSIVKNELSQSFENGALLLCSLQDPGNVGTILRSAEAFGLSAVIVTADCPDAVSPKVLRASMGAALRIPIFCVENAAEAIGCLRENGVDVFAASLGKDSVSVDEVSLCGAVVAIGNEGAGLSAAEAAACGKRVILPISENSESLNAAMAATVFAWELSKARRFQSKGGCV